MDEIKIGQLSIRTVSLKEEGVFTDAKNEEQNGKSYKFLLDGVSKYSIIIQLVEFDDGTAIVGLEGDYIGPRYLFTHLYSRLRIGITPLDLKKWCEIRVPKESPSKKDRITAQKASLDLLDEDFGMNGVISTLKQFGILDIDTRESVLGDTSNRRNHLAAIWDANSLVAPVVVFVITRLLPLMHLLVVNPEEKDDIIYYGPNSKQEKEYSLDRLLQDDENSNLEFKESAFFSPDEKTYGENITHNLERNIAGMLNGIVDAHIFIGIDKHNNKNGVAKDFQFVDGKTNAWDSYLLKLRSSLINQFGLGIVTNYISIGWEEIGYGKDNPVVDIFIRPIPEDQELVKDRNGEVWIRTLNGTQKPYSPDELKEYKKLRKIR
tara:strand:+ start:6232 stop:7362 length:1131 start_codon:yes stop_codon:yes gene_type:complete